MRRVLPKYEKDKTLTDSSVIFLLLLVSRSKLIPDFAFTIHFIHLIATTFYTHSVPANWLWWGLQFSSASVMTSLGIWACRWRELKPISIGIGASSQQQAGSSSQPNPESEGSSRGRGRGRNMPDGGGDYEMVRMKEMGEEGVWIYLDGCGFRCFTFIFILFRPRMMPWLGLWWDSIPLAHFVYPNFCIV